MNTIDKFNDLFNEFIDKIITRYPNQTLREYKKGFILIKLASPQSPANFFMAGCIDYKEQIKNRDEVFFINSESIKSKINSFSVDIGIANYWNELTETTKTAIWDYIQSLYVLGEMIIKKDPTEFNKIRNSDIENYSKDISDFREQKFSTEFLSKLNS